MGKIALLLPEPNLFEKVENVLKEIHVSHEIHTEYVTYSSISAAEKLANTSDLFIARGRVSYYVRSTYNLPVVNMEITPRELGMLFIEARTFLNQDYPRIDIVCYKNSICDTSNFSQIFKIDLHTHLISPSEDPSVIRAAVDAAIADGAKFIIGSITAVEHAKAAGIPALQLRASEDSLRNAIHIANITLYARELERANTNRLQALIDNLFCAVIEVDKNGCLSTFNNIAADEFALNQTKDRGKPLSNILSSIPFDIVESVIETGKEIFVSGIQSAHSVWSASITPVFESGNVSGAIILCQKAKTIEHMDILARRNNFKPKHFAIKELKCFVEDCPKMFSTIQSFSASTASILISGETGCEAQQIAQAIHNDSILSQEPFIEVNCGELREEEQIDFLFGTETEKGCFLNAHQGTIFLNRLDLLCPVVQHRITRILQNHTIFSKGLSPIPVFVRIISYIPKPIDALSQGTLLPELFYALNVLRLDIPPLRERPNDTKAYLNHFLQISCERYEHIIVLTADAEKNLISYPWQGNVAQLQTFCDKLVLYSTHRSISGGEVQQLLQSSYPDYSPREERIFAAFQTEAELIRSTLEKNNWQRGITAEELHISTTTLWRRMNKYGITKK